MARSRHVARCEKPSGSTIAWRLLPDAVVDLAMEAQYGQLSPGRCLAVLLNVNGQRSPALPAPVAVAPAPQPRVNQTISNQANSTAMQVAGEEAAAAMKECRAKRLSGELKTFVASAQCSGPRIIQAFSKANYRYMDLVVLWVAKRAQIAERLDRKEISETDANVALQQAFTDIVTTEKARDAMQR